MEIPPKANQRDRLLINLEIGIFSSIETFLCEQW